MRECTFVTFWKPPALRFLLNFSIFDSRTTLPVIHLIGAIENDNVFSQCFAHIFDGFCFAGASWTARAEKKNYSFSFSTAEQFNRSKYTFRPCSWLVLVPM